MILRPRFDSPSRRSKPPNGPKFQSTPALLEARIVGGVPDLGSTQRVVERLIETVAATYGPQSAPKLPATGHRVFSRT